MSIIVLIFLCVFLCVFVGLHILWVPFYMHVKALGIVPQEPPHLGDVYLGVCGCMNTYECASTRRSQRSFLSTNPQVLLIFVL